MAPPTQDAYQIGWICALPVELAAAQQMLDENFGGPDVQDSTDTNSYVLGRIGKHYVVIAGLPGGQYGTTSATTVATNMLRTFSRSLRVRLMVGIGGGIPSADHDIRLGDIVVSYPQGTCGGVVQYDMGKVLEEGRIQRTGTLNSPPRSLLTAVSKMKADDMMMADDPSYLNYIETAIEKNAKMRKHFGRPDASTDRLFRIQHEHPANIATCGGCGKEWEEPRNMRKEPGPQVHYGIIASGNRVIKHGVTREQLRQETGALCFEMEAAGLMTDFPCIVIRGICDYADSHKNKEWQGYAALAAAAYAKQLLSYVPVTQISQEKSAADRRLPSFKHQGSGNIFNAKKIQNKSTGKGLMFSGAHITGPVTIEQHFGTQEPPQQLQDCSKSLDFRQIEADSNSIDPATGQVIDPLSCLAVVAAVVPFIDFATHLLSDDCDIYHSVHEGTLNMFTMSTLATDLGLLYHNIAVQSNFLAHGHRFDGRIDSALIGISSTCKEICIQLQGVSEELDAKVYKKSLKPLGEAERAEKERQLPPKYQYHFQSKIDGLKKNFMVELGEHASEHTQPWLSVLISARRQVMRAAITTLWEPLNSASEVGQRRVAVKAPAPWHTKNSVRILSQSFLKVIQKVVPNPDSITSLTMEEFSQPGMQSTRHRTVENMEPSGQHIIWTMAGCDDGSCPFPIIQSLAFQGIHRREDTIPTAYMKTFDWIFTKPRVGANGQEQWSDYTSWLRGPTAKIYWITGKLGAGKSTLMKFLVEHNDVRKHLEHWSSQRQLVIASFYFWNTGDEMQKSQAGLLRTLLSQILAQIPSITAKVCPRHWALCKTFGRQAIRLAPKWTWDELVESFSLLSDLIGVEFQLALFIDGLDEFDGDHGVLLDFIKHLQTRSGIKICVSSRHWNMFLDAFKSEPCLRVEDLTKADIETFVSGEFGRSVGFQELRINFPSKANQFVQDIVTKANGVFLWVSLVVRTLCEAFTNGDPLSSIQATLDGLPSDLSELYERIWRSISFQYIRHSSQLFQIQYASTLPLHVITFWLADEDDHLEDDITVLRENGGNYVRDAIVRRLNSRTKGLLEVSSDSYVNYLHRSVKDWVEKEWSNICSESASNFDPHLCLLKALVIETADDELWDPRESVMATTTEEIFWGRVGVYFYHASLIRNQRPNFQLLAKVLQKLDCNLDKVCKVHRVAAPDTRGRHNVEHWSNQQRAGNSNTLLSFAAQCAVTPYVQFMVETNTKCFRLPASRQQILHAAIFGFEHFSHEAVLRWCGFNSKFAPLESRLELVRFLCESGVCRENPSQMPRSSVERKIFEMVQEHNRSCVDEKEKSYWDDVEKLLQTNRAKKEKKPSRWKDKGLGLFKKRDDFSWDDEAMRGSPR